MAPAAGRPFAPGENALLLDADGMARLVAGEHPRVETGHNRWIEYAAPS
jgi:hypothetical protein